MALYTGATYENGLRGDYRNVGYGNLPPPVTVTRTDKDLKYPYGTGDSPESVEVGGRHQYWLPPGIDWRCSVVWTGQIYIEHDEPYQFYMSYDDATALIVDGQTIFQHLGHVWSNPIRSVGSPITFSGNCRWVSITLTNSNYGGPHQVRLQWSTPSMERQDVPSSHLRTRLR